MTMTTSVRCAANAGGRVHAAIVTLVLGLMLAGICVAEEAAAPADSASVAGLSLAVQDGKISDAVASRLGAEQLYELIKREQDARFARPPENVSANVIPVVAITGFFATIVLAVFIPLFMSYRRGSRQQALFRQMVEKGIPIPSYLVVANVARNDLRTGVILLCVGAGVSLALANLPGVPWQLGLIPLCIGAGYVVTGLLDSPRGRALLGHAPTAVSSDGE